MKLTSTFVLAALTALPLAGAVHFILPIRPVVTTRLDPIVSTHVHTVAGASGFNWNYNYDDLIKSECTTAVIPQDKSNYWTPVLYHYNRNNGSFTAMPNGFNIYYLVRGTDVGDKVVAPPKGLRMLAGDPNRRTYNASSFADQAISYVCLDYDNNHAGDPDWAERPNFFTHQCPGGLRAQVFFPSCWDGKNLDSPDHKSHMSYPVENYNGGHCPPSHPVHIISLFYEMFIQTQQYSYDGPGTWIWANGDDSGYGLHGDFTMGWTDINLLQSAIDDCPNMEGNIPDCPHLKAVLDNDAANACRFRGNIVNEDIGDQHPISALPGCNKIWSGTGPKPTCNPNPPTPGLTSTQQPLPVGWTELGCIAEGTSGRALTGASTVDPALTKAKCATFCAGKGFKYAGVEYSQECYCGNSLTNGASTNQVPAVQCNNVCGGTAYDNCGGPSRLSLLQKTG
ncbi:WSC-domain-containing protein [Panus rudis PR-1116 ss-1]|nr:WSC-domain-containing protein [Panus rudis PR-1116 ss-1]